MIDARLTIDAAPAALHLRHGVPRHQVGALEVDLDDPVPDLLRAGLRPHRVAAGHARAVDQHVELPIGVYGGVDHRLRVLGVGDVPGHDYRVAADCLYLVGGLPRAGLAYVGDDDPGPFAGEQRRGGASYAGASAGDQRDLVL